MTNCRSALELDAADADPAAPRVVLLPL